MDVEILKLIGVSLILGFAVGMQRSITYLQEGERPFAGSRTFALIALAGWMAGWISQHSPAVLPVAAAGIFVLVALAYYFKAAKEGRRGMTTQIAAVVTFFLGVMVWYRWVEYAVFIAVLVIVLLEIKPRLRRLESHISPTDIQAVVLLLAMTFVVLPILPDRLIGPLHLFNPYQTWLMAIIIAAISFIGYVAIKLFGQKYGLYLTGAAGGLISSTAVSITLSKMYRGQPRLINNYAGGIAIACTFMYFRVLFEAFVVHPHLAWLLLPAFSGAGVTGLLIVWWFYRHSPSAQIDLENSTIAKNPLQLSEAIKFGILFGLVFGAITFVKSRYGDMGVYLVSFFSGLTDVDAITLSLSELAKSGKLAEFASMTGIVIASITNSLVKLGITFWLGGARLGWRLAWFFAVTLGAMTAGLFLGGRLL